MQIEQRKRNALGVLKFFFRTFHADEQVWTGLFPDTLKERGRAVYPLCRTKDGKLLEKSWCGRRFPDESELDINFDTKSI